MSNISDDTPICTEIVAETVVNELLCGEIKTVMTEKEYVDAYKHLVEHAETIYQHNADFRKKIKGKGNRGRDYLYSFMRHWLSAWVAKNIPKLFAEIPDSFKNGIPMEPKARV